MTYEIAMNTNALPKDTRTGLTLPLSASLGSQALSKHRAMVAFELEVLSKKMDRFGWDREADTPFQNRIITDWMDALQDYPLEEIKQACKAAVAANPNKIPNEGHIVGQILKARREFVAAHPPRNEPEPERKPVDRERAAAIMAEAGFAPRKFGGDA